MKLFSDQAELAAIRAMTSPKGRSLLSKLNENSFHLEQTQEAWARAAHLAKATGEIPSYSELCIDPSLSEETRKLLVKRKVPIPAKPEAIIEQLDQYTKIRGLFTLYREGLEELKKPKVNLSKMLDQATESLTAIRLQRNLDKLLHHIGTNNNTEARIKKLLYGKRDPTIKTGFPTFDERNGGLPSKGLVVLTANVGGLKSTMAQQLLDNMYLDGRKVVMASFEMTFEELAIRMFARHTGVNSMDIMLSRLTKRQRQQLWDFYQGFVKQGKKKGGRLTILDSTDTALGIRDVLGAVEPYGPEVVVIDYVTLLADAASDAQAQALSDVARYAKMWSKRNALVILLAQLNDENKIRYSRAISEHADVWWRWTVGPNERESGLIDIDQAKARNQTPFPFSLAVDFPTLHIFDSSTNDGAKRALGGSSKKAMVAEKTSKLKRGIKPVGEDDDNFVASL